MDTVFDILTGAGLAAAVGIRPFLPALAAGAFATADLAIDFDGTAFSFLEKPGFLLALVLALIAITVLQRRGESSLVENAIALIAVVLGALLFAGTLDDGSDTWWPGIPAGVLLAGLAFTAVRGLFQRVHARLDPDARGALPVYADGAALLAAVAAIVAPPLAVVIIGFLVWLLLGSRRREGEKYAGLRILR